MLFLALFNAFQYAFRQNLDFSNDLRTLESLKRSGMLVGTNLPRHRSRQICGAELRPTISNSQTSTVETYDKKWHFSVRQSGKLFFFYYFVDSRHVQLFMQIHIHIHMYINTYMHIGANSFSKGIRICSQNWPIPLASGEH